MVVWRMSVRIATESFQQNYYPKDVTGVDKDFERKAMKMSERCKSYVGVACVDGTCPVARADDWSNESVPVSCDECWLYKGCEDCALYGTNECEEAKGK